MTLPPSARFVRCLAHAVTFLYPPRFRRLHGREFPEVALHRWQREAARTTPLGATVTATRLLMKDTVTGSTVCWMEAATDENESTPSLRGMVRSAGRWLGDGGRDIRLAARAMARRPAAALLIILTLGLGIGTSTAAFDALDRAIWHPLPFAGGDRLVFLSVRDRLRNTRFMPTPDQFRRWRENAKSIERVEVYEEQTLTRLEDSGAILLPALAVTAGLPGMLDVRPLVGRMLGPEDAGAGPISAVMLSEPFWRREFGADPGVVGRVIRLATGPATIVGVWPQGARLSMREMPAAFVTIPADRQISRSRFSYLLARLAPGVSRADAERDLTAVMQEPPASTEAPALDSQAFMFLGSTYIAGVWLVFAGALALFVVAIANAAVLLLDQAAQRGRELGVRLALGSSGARLVRLFLAEGVVYALAGALVGIGVAVGVEAAVAAYEPRLFSPTSGAGLAGRALWFACGAAGLVAVICSLAPLVRLRSTDVREALVHAGHRTTTPPRRAQRVLVAAQATVAVLLLSGAGLMARSFANLMRVDTGLALDHLAELSVAPPSSRYPTPEAKKAYIARVMEALETMPGVTGVTTSGMPLLNASIQNGLPRLDGEAAPERVDDAVTVLTSGPVNYFAVMGIRITAGRGFETADKNVAIVNEGFALSRGGNVLGRSIYTPMGKTPFTIVGVANDTRVFNLTDDRQRFQIYMPEMSVSETFARFILRTTGDPSAALRDARVRLAGIDNAVPMRGAQTGREVFRRQTAQHRFVVVLLAGVAGLALLLALSGVYGTVALSMSHRAREMGIRLALGAAPASLRRAFVRSELRPVVAGGALGIVAAWFAVPFMQVLLFAVRPHDPVSAAVAIVAIGATAAIAAVIPARRVSRIDPALTLRAL